MKYFNWKTMLRVILTEEGKFTQKSHIKACYSTLMHSHCAFGRLYRSLKNAATKNKTFWVSTTYIKWNDFCSDHGTWLTSNTITGSKWWPLCFHFLHLQPFPGGFVSLFSRKQVITTARARALNQTLAFCLAQWLLRLCRCCHHCIHALWHLYQRCLHCFKPSKTMSRINVL